MSPIKLIMKILTIVCCFFLSINAFSESRDTLIVDTVHHGASPKKTFTPDGPIQTGAALMVVDGEIYKGDIKDIRPKDIINTEVLNGASAAAIYGSQAINGAIIIVTRPYAIAAYEKKIGTLSSKYKEYIGQKHDDVNLAYVIDNTIKDQQKTSTIEDLYQLSVSNIVKVQFKKDSHFSTDATVIITTKDN